MNIQQEHNNVPAGISSYGVTPPLSSLMSRGPNWRVGRGRRPILRIHCGKFLGSPMVGTLKGLIPGRGIRITQASKQAKMKKERNFLAKVKAWGEQCTVNIRKTVRNVAPWKHNKRACWLSEMWVFLKVEIQTRIATEHLSHHSGTNPYPSRQWCVEFGLLSLRLLTAVWRKQWGHADLPSEFQRLQ